MSASRIAQLIAAQGPLSIAQFMTLALHDPRRGYYSTRDPFGAGGDFITAPEMSQMFGELLGLWIVQCWRDQGAPKPARLVELGPGRGTLMADALRAARRVPEFLAAIEVVMVEASPALRKIQYEKLSKIVRAAPPPHPALSPDGGEGNPSHSLSPSGGEGRGEGAARWVDHFDSSLLDRPLFLIANEFFDALPIRQFVKTPRGWCERMVTADESGKLAFALAPIASIIDIPAARGEAQDGAVYEISPASAALAQEIARVIAEQGGAALIVDYGHDGIGFGETLQAVAQHKFTGILDAPGEADLSAHVDFAALAQAARAGGAKTFGPVGQGALLEALGLRERAAQLAQKNPGEARAIESAVDRLTNPAQMGHLFKALAIMPNGASRPPGF
ncbi:MAG TPA: SAM-dependent methyltransferase [Rhizomicrobium sp.]|nr:SAM-dependent methyltransferase [Rhizomicrobium sp.]